ncbi:KQDN repeat-containing protein [Legionella donaldsonii]|uniref:KQDN repeat-containing protein n=1 Tax=Legionella donaldsonii TaxID=45060 RepID=A0A378J7C3_9GAMM|nr:BatD family protein [Legionella donaldsonii]STX40430.1 KQDN repeat-containing protein [Legionella donaldsonii]
MKRILISLFLCCCLKVVFADVTVQLDVTQVQLGQPFSLTLTLDSAVDSVPDLTPLQKNFTILGTERSMNYSVINGQAHSVSQWIITLTANRNGVLPIPSLQIGQEYTKASSIEVTSEETPTTNVQPQTPQQDAVLETDVSVNNPFVNQQVIFTTRLYYSSRLLDASYQPPQVEDALMIPLGQGRHYQISSNNKIYAVEEQQYAIFPQKSGDLKINPPAFNALIYSVTPKRVHLQAKPTVLHVKPRLAGYKYWLAAKQVSLSETYDKNTITLMQGDTLVRTVKLSAVAVPAQLLPTLDFGSSDQFSVYPEKPQEKTSFKHPNLVSSTTVKATYLLNKAGQITIPAIKLTWFNTTTGKKETSALPALTLNVVASAGETKQSASAAVANTEPVAHTTEVDAKKEQQITLPSLRPETNVAWWLASAFAIAWLLTLGLWYRQRRQQAERQTAGQVMKQLAKACLDNHATEARDALLKWARFQWPEANLLNLTDVEKMVDDTRLKEEINQLAQALYQDVSPQKTWQGTALWAAITSFKGAKLRPENSKMTPLPPIHRL